jgi:hypothetical protein
VAGRTTLGRRAFALAAFVSLTAAGVADASERVTVKAARAADRTCHAAPARAGAAGVAVRRYTAEATGVVRARLRGGGDWDIGIFDARTRRTVAGSAAMRPNELAEGFVLRGQRLIVQACRIRGGARTARLEVASVALPKARAADDGPTQVVTVRTDSSGIRRLQQAGLT